MSKVIADILNVDRIKFRDLLDALEAKSGRNSYDNAIYSQMRSSALLATKELGLDVSDTAVGELYFVLQERAKQDNALLERYLGISPDDTPEKTIKKIVAWLNKNSHQAKNWTVKSSLFKVLLKKQPPKVVMKSLGLRSVDSMLKRNDPSMLVALASLLEKPEWNQKFNLNYKKLGAVDFDYKKTNLVVVDKKFASKLVKAGYDKSRVVLPHYISGGVFIFPPVSRFPLDSLAFFMLLSETFLDVSRHSTFYKFISVRSDFAKIIYDTIESGINITSNKISKIGWNSLHRHLVGNSDFDALSSLPHIDNDDFVSVSPLEVLVKINSRFEFWNSLEYVFYGQDGKSSISMNLADTIINSTNRRPYFQSSRGYGRAKLWEELWARYLRSDSVAEEVISNYLAEEN